MAADGPRYKQCGNSMATKVMRWLGERIHVYLAARQPMLGHNRGPSLFDDILGGDATDDFAAVLG